MSHTYSLVCHETKKKIWIGQGWSGMTTFYSGSAETMEKLRRFLCDHYGKNIVFLCDIENETFCEYKEY